MARVEGIDVTNLDHLADPDWENPEDRRCIAASLVNVAYLLERQRNKADEWCCLLQFDIIETIEDDDDNSIIGVVYQWRGESKPSEGGPPSLVVAFRGTLLQPRTAFKDLYIDLKIFLGCLNSSDSRVSKGVQSLESIIKRQKGSDNVWIAGHSLGASIAVVAAKHLVKKGHNFESHLFNPPFVSQWLTNILHKIGMVLSKTRNVSLVLKNFQQQISSLLPHLMKLVTGLKDHNKLKETMSDFLAVRDWMPNLYVNDKDLICSNYLSYFEEWRTVCGDVNGIYLVQNCVKYVFSFEALPSAKIVVPMRRVSNNHHGISQWYSKDLLIRSTEFVPPAEAVSQVQVGDVRLRALAAFGAPDNDEEDSVEQWWTFH